MNPTISSSAMHLIPTSCGEKMQSMMLEGFCECGCGEKAPIVTHTSKKRGRVKGQPGRFISGHNGRKQWIDAGRECSRCGEFKPWDEFHDLASSVRGKRPDCKKCYCEYMEAYRPADQYQRWVKPWRAKNPEKCAGYVHKHRAQKAATQSGPIDWGEVFANGNLCGICGDPIEDNVQIDHIYPLSKGGPHVTENLQAAHARCNNRKRATIPEAA